MTSTNDPGTPGIHPGSTTDDPGAAAATPRRGVAVPTVIWGLFVTLVGAGALASLLGARFDDELAIIVLLAAAGVALVAVSVVTAVRRR